MCVVERLSSHSSLKEGHVVRTAINEVARVQGQYRTTSNIRSLVQYMLGGRRTVAAEHRDRLNDHV